MPKRKPGSRGTANVFFRLLRWHAAEPPQNRHRRRCLAAHRAFSPTLIYQPDSAMCAVMETLLQVGSKLKDFPGRDWPARASRPLSETEGLLQ